MNQNEINWETSQNSVGILISDTALYQRKYPKDDVYGMAYSDTIDHFSSFYGLALPLLERGIPVTPVSMENLIHLTGYLKKYKVLMLSYEFMKPTTPAVHYILHEWVKKGGVLVYVGDDGDSFHQVKEWWNTGDCNYYSPADHLVEVFGLTTKIKTLKKKTNQTTRILLDCIYPTGKGQFVFFNDNPSNCAREADYAHFLRKLIYTASEKVGFPIKVSKSLIMNRGPYKIIAVMDDDNRENVAINGCFANLLAHDYEVETFIVAEPGSIYLLYDLDTLDSEKPEIIAVSGRSEDESITENGFRFTVKAPANMECSCRVFLPFTAELRIDGKVCEVERDETQKTVFFRFNGTGSTKIEFTKTNKK